MSTNGLNYNQVNNVKRRTWDVDAYEKKAQEKARKDPEDSAATSTVGRKGQQSLGGEKEQGGEKAPKRFKTSDDDEEKEEFKPAEPGRAGPQGSQRAFLQPRTGKVDIDSKIGATEMVSAEVAAKTSLNEGVKDGVTKSGVGWHCRVCDCFLKDSLTYLDHINGRKHQRKLGYTMRVERSTKDQMIERLAKLAKEKELTDKAAQLEMAKFETNYEEVVKAKDEAEAQRRAEIVRKRKERKKEKRTAKVQNKPEEEEQPVGDSQEDEEVEEGGINPDMAAIMGFSGFGGGK